jgi:hypothetical protein
MMMMMVQADSVISEIAFAMVVVWKREGNARARIVRAQGFALRRSNKRAVTRDETRPTAQVGWDRRDSMDIASKTVIALC